MNNEKVYIEGYIVGVFKETTLEKIGNRIQLANGEIVDIDYRFIHKSINPEKVKIPQFVADYIKDAKYYEWDLDDVFDHIAEESEESEIYIWFYPLGNVDILARAWLDGYEVEKEKRYEVILCNGQSLKTVYRQGGDRLDFEKEYGDLERFTRKQLEEANFGWVFDCPGIEVREVTE